jgi:hypothetical protein
MSSWNVKTALAEVGGLGKPSKMPSFSYNLPALECKVGSKLRLVEGSVCWKCYALKGRYMFPNVQNALYKRLDLMRNNPNWISAMAWLINWYGKKTSYFRWHDSGDVQDMKHLKKIVKVAKLTPTVKHWLPTREAKIVKEYTKEYGDFPSNLIVRISATMIDGKPHSFHKHTSTVVVKSESAIDWVCPSNKQDNECKDCRACWDKDVKDVAYIQH